jgi:hypothetical protein
MQPIISYMFGYEGTEEEASEWASHFTKLEPLNIQVSTVDYVELYTITQNGLDSPSCRANQNLVGNGISLPSWNTTALREVFDIYTELTDDPRYASAAMLMENYGMKGVESVDASTTALPLEERQYPILTSPVIWWNGTDPQDTADAIEYGERIRKALFDGNGGVKKHTYVNYASGTESIEQVYGYEEWRVNKLKSLKKELDPKNRFGFFNPIPVA